MADKRDSILEVAGLKKLFSAHTSLFGQLFGREKFVRAVDSVSFTINSGEMFCMVGESGCGKTTTGKVVAGIYEPTAGDIYYKGRKLSDLPKHEYDHIRHQDFQMIYQDPYNTLNPRWRVKRIVREGLDVNRIPGERHKMVMDAMARAKLAPPEKYLDKFPPELSGGERQRVAIARTLVMDPKVIVADEPVSMLDVSIRVGILKLFKELGENFKWAGLFITHDFAQAKHIGTQIAVMYLGEIVEQGEAREIIQHPLHPYTRALISNIPKLGGNLANRITLRGDLPSAVHIPAGCRFHSRCYEYENGGGDCDKVKPSLLEHDNRLIRCHKRNQEAKGAASMSLNKDGEQ